MKLHEESGSPSGDRDRGSELRAQFNSTREDIERQVQATRQHLDEVNERIEAKAGRNLIAAIGIGLLVGGGVLLSLIFVKEIFLVAATALIAAASVELANAFRTAGRRIDVIPLATGSVLVMLSGYLLAPEWRWGVLVVVLLALVLWRVLAARLGAEAGPARLTDVTATVLVLVYISVLGSVAMTLLAQDGGQWWVLAFIILVVSVDTGAYAAGVLLGRHPMAPRISPKKTWEGFAGAAVASQIAGILVSVLMLGQSWVLGVVFGALILLTATMGDLGESLIKRDLGIKDMSSWFPGHGGILDRLDSMLPSAPMAFGVFIVSTLL
ncbi:Phosphatidate cytidylyltransferase [Mycetocola reblochoni REB411]|uniref:Phosphatidate cytidylyltransferase n=1 Tax=Mycetocola reblochoni REB411 TaxID=1255698 RepID=A0A1R4JCC9_9MICO|nr:Phosphatidate cytidylyltransferase [Mycetocola reblochoni REB411]